jgi:hypothetical protein
MRVNKTLILGVTVIAAILLCAMLANMRYITPPRLMIKFDGKPASNVRLVLPASSEGPFQLDKEGSITAREIGWTETSILVPFPNGGGASVGFPKHGTKTVDFQGRVTTTTVVQYFGLVSDQYQSFNLTDEEMADIESGRRSSAEIIEAIRRKRT